jgi:hypothetical protein
MTWPGKKVVSIMSYEPLYNKDSSSPAGKRDGRKLILSVDDDLAGLYTRSKLLAAQFTVFSVPVMPPRPCRSSPTTRLTWC